MAGYYIKIKLNWVYMYVKNKQCKRWWSFALCQMTLITAVLLQWQQTVQLLRRWPHTIHTNSKNGEDFLGYD